MLRLVSTVTPELDAKWAVQKVESVETAELKEDEVLIRVEAAPINPSDILFIIPPGATPKMMAGARPLNPEADEGVGMTYPLDPSLKESLGHRIGNPTFCGSEGAGVVIKTGSGAYAKSLMGKVVSTVAGQMYAPFKVANVKFVVVHNEGTTPEEAASSFVNPMTVVSFVETMRRDKHDGIIHTAAASQLGQMLVRYCKQEGVTLINVVRKESQEKTLRDLGAEYVVRSDKPTYIQDLAELVAKTKITLAFDAIGGGDSAQNLLVAMEEGAKKFGNHNPASPYGTDVLKRVYNYGALESSPTMIKGGFGFCWSLTAWLVMNFLATLPVEDVMRLQKSVADNIKTVFKTNYYKKVSLEEAVTPENFFEYVRTSSGKKFLVLPQKDLDSLKAKKVKAEM